MPIPFHLIPTKPVKRRRVQRDLAANVVDISIAVVAAIAIAAAIVFALGDDAWLTNDAPSVQRIGAVFVANGSLSAL